VPDTPLDIDFFTNAFIKNTMEFSTISKQMESYHAKVHRFWFLAFQIGSIDLFEYLKESMNQTDFSETFGECGDELYLSIDDGFTEGFYHSITRHNLLGFLSEIRIPHFDKIEINQDGTTGSFRVVPFISSCYFLYANSAEDLIDKIKATEAQHMKTCIARQIAKQTKTQEG
jgi:hypothetical protein